MNSKLYRRKPKNWLQRVWFWFRPKYTISMNSGWMPDCIILVNKLTGRCRYMTVAHFEANYEPVKEKP